MEPMMPANVFLAAVLAASAPSAVPPVPGLDTAEAGRFAELVLSCVHREYPNKIAHVLNSDADVLPPRELTPVFFGCFDWHSAVHGHWLLARLARVYPEAPFAKPAREALARGLTRERVATEVAYLSASGRETFERPYGLAWLLQLALELEEWESPEVREWASALAPLARLAAGRFTAWLPRLTHPIRTGEHSQTAFAFGLVLDWARGTGDDATAELVARRTAELYLEDRSCPLAFEPSAQDFLSPCLAQADLVRRILPPPVFAAWLGAFLPEIPLDGRDDWLALGVVTDPSDGKLAHLDGLNLSRAWMLEGIVAGLPQDDPRRSALLAVARRHREAGVASVTGEHYEGGHWLGSFAVYLVTGRGLPATRLSAKP